VQTILFFTGAPRHSPTARGEIRTNDIISRGSPFDADPYKYRDDVRTNQASPLGEGDRVSGGRGLFAQRIMYFFGTSWAPSPTARGEIRTHDIISCRSPFDAYPYKYRDFVRAIIIVFYGGSKIYALPFIVMLIANFVSAPSDEGAGFCEAKD